MLALAVKSDSIDSVKFELYIRARNNPVYIGGSYPIEGSIRAYKLCIEKFNTETPISLKRQIPNILAGFIKKTQGACQDLIRYQRMSVDAEIDAWNGSMLAYYLGYVAGANKKPLPYKEMAKYYTLSAEASLAKKYHFGKYCKNQVNSILVAAKFEYDLSNPKKALELLTELLKSKDYSKAVRGEITLYSGLASMKLKKYAEAKVHFTETIKLTKNNKFKKQAKDQLAKLKKIKR